VQNLRGFAAGEDFFGWGNTEKQAVRVKLYELDWLLELSDYPVPLLSSLGTGRRLLALKSVR